MLIMQEALPLFKVFLKPVSALKPDARQLVLRCVIAFLMHLGKMSASSVAGAVPTDARHRAQVSRFLGRRYWRRGNPLGQLRAQLLEMEARQGTFVFDIDQTYCSQQGKLTENTISRGDKAKRPKKSKNKPNKHAPALEPLFRDGLADYPQRNSGAVFRELLHQGLLRGEDDPAPQADRIGRATDPRIAFAPRSARGGLGRHRLRRRGHPERTCAERQFSWIVPTNPERVLAGEKPRPKVSSLSQDLTTDQMVRLEVHPGQGKYVAYRRIARYRIGPKFKPRTYYVHEESRDVHSVGKVRLFFSTTQAPAPDHPVPVQKILMTKDATLSLRDVIELYQLRWQIELFFKELKSTLGFHHYRFKEFEKVETWVTLCLLTFVYLEWIRAQIETEIAEEEREGVVASPTNVRSGPGRASGGRTARTEVAGGQDRVARRAKSACQEAQGVPSEGIPRGDLIGRRVENAQLQN